MLATSKCPAGEANWFRKGYEHGSAGYRVDRSFVEATYGKVCNAQSGSIDFPAYQRGAVEGRGDYCTVERVYWLGRRSGKGFFPAICPPEKTPVLAHANALGRKARQYERKIERIESRDVPGVPDYRAPHDWERPVEDRRDLRDLERRLEALPGYPKPSLRY